jgi:hypothetical protein
MSQNFIQDIAKHQFHREERFLLDANIWLYTYGPSVFRSEDINHVYNDSMTKMIANK